jgi:hypothetical protein
MLGDDQNHQNGYHGNPKSMIVIQKKFKGMIYMYIFKVLKFLKSNNFLYDHDFLMRTIGYGNNQNNYHKKK